MDKYIAWTMDLSSTHETIISDISRNLYQWNFYFMFMDQNFSKICLEGFMDVELFCE